MKRFISFILISVMILQIGFSQKASAKIGIMDLYDAQGKAMAIADALADFGEGEYFRCSKKLAAIGVETVLDGTLASVYSAVGAAVSSTNYIVNSSVNYYVDKKYDEYESIRAKAYYDARAITPEKAAKWVSQSREQFNEYWDGIGTTGPIYNKFVEQVIENRLKKEGLDSWWDTHINPFSEKAKKYNEIVRKGVTTTEVFEEVYNAWESRVLAAYLPSIMNETKEFEDYKLKFTYFSIRGFINFDKQPTDSNYELKAYKNNEYISFFYPNSSQITSVSFPYRIDIPFFSLKKWKLSDKLTISLFNRKTKKNQVLASIPMSEIIKAPYTEDGDSYYKIYNAGNLEAKAGNSEDKDITLNIKGILPDGRTVNLLLDNVIKFFATDIKGQKDNHEVVIIDSSEKASLQYTDETSGKAYFTVAEININGNSSMVSFPEAPAAPLLTKPEDFYSEADYYLGELSQNKISTQQYNQLINKMLESRNDISSDERNKMYDYSEAAFARSKSAAENSFNSQDESYYTRFEDLKNKLVSEIDAASENYSESLLPSPYCEFVYQKEDDLKLMEKHFSDLKQNLSNIQSYYQTYQNLWKEYTDFLRSFNWTKSELIGDIKGKCLLYRNYFESAMDSINNIYLDSKYEEAFNEKKLAYQSEIDNMLKQANEALTEIKQADESSYNYYEERYSKIRKYADSFSEEELKKQKQDIGLFLDNCSNYYRCKMADIYGWTIWEEGYKKYRLDGLLALNKLNNYFGGTVLSEDYIRANSEDTSLVLPLLEGYLNYAEIVKELDDTSLIDELNSTKSLIWQKLYYVFYDENNTIYGESIDSENWCKRFTPLTYSLIKPNYPVDTDYNAIDYIYKGVLQDEGKDSELYKLPIIEQPIPSKGDKLINLGSKTVSKDKVFQINFSAPINKASLLDDTINVLDSNGAKVPVIIQTYGNSVKVYPKDEYKASQSYTIKVKAAIQTLDYKYLNKDFELNFTVQ